MGLVAAASPRRRPWAARAAAAAGIVFVLGAGAVTAYATGTLGAAAEFLQDVFGMREEQVEDVSRMAGVAGSSANDGGVTVCVSAVIGDDTFYAVVYTLEPEDPALFDDVERFERLRELRRELAAGREVPPYIVCNDKTLRGICRLRPHTREELLGVSGSGERKADEFGEAFLAAVIAFEDERG